MKTLPIIRDNTPEEEAEIQRQIAEDPDTWAAPANAKVLKRGRPTGETKAQVTVRLDKSLIEQLKTPDPKGWQTRLNAAALRGLTVGRDTPYSCIAKQGKLFSQIAQMRCIEPETNKRRFYRMSLQPDLFGGRVLMWEWGRIGSSGGQLRCDHFSDDGLALNALARLAKRK